MVQQNSGLQVKKNDIPASVGIGGVEGNAHHVRVVVGVRNGVPVRDWDVQHSEAL